MDRPARSKKTVNYSDFVEDEDFATVKAPPNKKARPCIKESQPEKPAKEITDMAVKKSKTRVSLDETMYNRDIEAALALSLLQTTENTIKPLDLENETSSALEDLPPVLTHFSEEVTCIDKPLTPPPEESPPVLSNCSVDVACLGLDKITSEQTSSPSVCTKRKTQKATKQQKQQNEDDDDYKPQNTLDSDSEFSDLDESEDEEYSVKRKEKKVKKSEKKPSSKAEEKEKKASKPKPSSAKNTVLNRSPATAQSLKKTPSTPPMTKSSLLSSPAGGRVPKWTPPGLVGRRDSSCQSPSVKTPGLGLRLGLSRLARVKPLHSNTVEH